MGSGRLSPGRHYPFAYYWRWSNKSRVLLFCRECPSGVALYQVEAPNRSFRPVVVTNDQLLLVMFGHEKKRDCLFVFQAQTGALVHKFPPRYQGMKECSALVPVPGKMTQIALMEQEKGLKIQSIHRLILHLTC